MTSHFDRIVATLAEHVVACQVKAVDGLMAALKDRGCHGADTTAQEVAERVSQCECVSHSMKYDNIDTDTPPVSVQQWRARIFARQIREEKDPEKRCMLRRLADNDGPQTEMSDHRAWCRSKPAHCVCDDWDEDEYDEDTGCSCLLSPCRLTAKNCSAEAERGHLEDLRSHPTGTRWHSRAIANAAWLGHLECLKYAVEAGAPWTRDVVAVIAREGHLECLSYVHEKGAPWHPNTCELAAEHGHLDCLTYAHEHGAPLGTGTCPSAGGAGHLECLRYAHIHGAPWTRDHDDQSDDQSDDDTCSSVMWSLQHGNGPYDTAGQQVQLECLRYAIENGAECASHILDHFAYDGNCTWMRILHEAGVEWSDDIISISCDSGGGAEENAALRYAHENGAPWPSKCDDLDMAPILVRERRRHHAAGTIGRAWRRHVRRRRAVHIIEIAVREWMLRPPNGFAYRRACDDFEMLNIRRGP